MICSNRGLCGGYNAGILREANASFEGLEQRPCSCTWSCPASGPSLTSASERTGGADVHPLRGQAEVRGGGGAGEPLHRRLHGREDRPGRSGLHEVPQRRPARRLVVETLLPLRVAPSHESEYRASQAASDGYEFLPSAANILEEILPVSFKVRLFKCFLDAAVSEQIARRVAMKAATENAEDMIKRLTRQYNRARQGRLRRRSRR